MSGESTWNEGALELDIEKPVAGGRMLARHEGRVVLVAGAIPGERVVARLERTAHGVTYAAVQQVLRPSEDRLPLSTDPACGGRAFAHVTLARQLALKRAIVEDALHRLARIASPAVQPTVSSPREGYRMRARFHVRNQRIGYYREATHDVCDVSSLPELLPATREVIRTLETRDLTAIDTLEIAENLPASERALHVTLGSSPAVEASKLSDVFAELGLSGVSAFAPGRGAWTIHGSPGVKDPVSALVPQTIIHGPDAMIHRHPAAFFQANRHVLPELVELVIERVREEPILDLFSGVGLFALACLASTNESVTAVEGDHRSSADLRVNVAAFGERASVAATSVEHFLQAARPGQFGTVILDPPRTGLSAPALRGVLRLKARRLIYVSCDVATLARDTRALIENGYQPDSFHPIDLFPDTPHVETVVAFTKQA